MLKPVTTGLLNHKLLFENLFLVSQENKYLKSNSNRINDAFHLGLGLFIADSRSAELSFDSLILQSCSHQFVAVELKQTRKKIC